MNVAKSTLLLAGISMLAGCQMQPNVEPGANKPNKDRSAEVTLDHPAYAEKRTTMRNTDGPKRGMIPAADAEVITEGEVFQLPKFVIKERRFLDLGFSLVTNREVLRGGAIQWAQVGVVLPGSLAARHNLSTGMQILAVDGVLITDMDRDRLIRMVFERQPGERIRLLVLSRQFGLLPVFVSIKT